MGKQYTSVPEMLADTLDSRGLKKMFVTVWNEHHRLRAIVEDQSKTINRLCEALILEAEQAKLTQGGGHNG